MLAFHAGHLDGQPSHLLPVDEEGDGLHPQHADGGDDGQDETRQGEGFLPYGDPPHQVEGSSQTSSHKEKGEAIDDSCDTLPGVQLLQNAVANQLRQGVEDEDDSGKGDEEVGERLNIVVRESSATVTHPFLVPHL